MIQIFADFDRNGRVSTQPVEYALRNQPPGVIIQPNLDIDGRSLSAFVSPASGTLTFDHQRTTKSSADDDLLLIKIVTTTPLPPNSRVELQLPIVVGDAIRLYDDHSHVIVSNINATNKVFPLTLNRSNRETNFKLESIAYGSIPFALSPQGLTPNTIIVTVAVFDAQNTRIATDTALVSVSPLILVGDTAPIERLYMAEVPDNTPSVQDVQNAMTTIGTPLVLVPATVNNGDTWLQDQFQLGFSHTPSGIQKAILHLPRLRSDSRPTLGVNNLATFVNDHFPSRNLGVIQDFWLRRITVSDAHGQQIHIPFIESDSINQKIDLLFRLRREVLIVLRENNSPFFNVTKNETDILRIRLGLTLLKGLVRNIYTLLLAAATNDAHRQFLSAKRDTLITAISNYETAVPIGHVGTAVTIIFSTPTITSIELEQQGIMLLAHRLSTLHSSHNYGGNIEISPPLTNHPFGKIVIGLRAFNDNPVDFDLSNFFSDQSQQPLVEVNTSWLQVGHVDEILSFVPSRGYGSSNYAILRASPDRGLKILNAAADLFWSGLNPFSRSVLSPNSRYYERRTGRDLHLSQNDHPVTHMLRGKFWLHKHDNDPISTPLEPPWIYRSMAEQLSGSLTMHHQFPYTPGPGADRNYPAHINVLEFLHFEHSTNQCIEDVLLAERPATPDAISGGAVPIQKTPDTPTSEQTGANNFDDCGVGTGLPDDEKVEFRQFLDDTRLDSILRSEFPNMSIISIPVLFDRMDDWSDEKTIAFLPDLVNIQILGNHVLIPRPYGPRMSIDDAITVLRTAMSDLDASFYSALNQRYIINKRLNQTWHWQDGGTNDTPEVSARDIANMFKDGFTETLDEIEELLVRNSHNRSVFDRNKKVRRGWHKIFIPENNVDLFETYTQLILERLGLTLHWVDSWYYHIHAGGIHCGTNALRRINGITPWWVNQPIT
jgi:Protein-arginine deiminase (PAD)